MTHNCWKCNCVLDDDKQEGIPIACSLREDIVVFCRSCFTIANDHAKEQYVRWLDDNKYVETK